MFRNTKKKIKEFCLFGSPLHSVMFYWGLFNVVTIFTAFDKAHLAIFFLLFGCIVNYLLFMFFTSRTKKKKTLVVLVSFGVVVIINSLLVVYKPVANDDISLQQVTGLFESFNKLPNSEPLSDEMLATIGDIGFLLKELDSFNGLLTKQEGAQLYQRLYLLENASLQLYKMTIGKNNLDRYKETALYDYINRANDMTIGYKANVIYNAVAYYNLLNLSIILCLVGFYAYKKVKVIGKIVTT